MLPKTVKIPNTMFELGVFPVKNIEYFCFCNGCDAHYPEWVENMSDVEYLSIKKSLLNDECPVVGISLEDAIAYCKWLSQQTGQTWRLPTEAEWEFAAHGGNLDASYLYAGSDNLLEVGWYRKSRKSELHPVGQLHPNSLGLYDMSGNVWEWTTTPHKRERFFITKGGCWRDHKRFSLIKERSVFLKSEKNNALSFRVLKEL